MQKVPKLFRHGSQRLKARAQRLGLLLETRKLSLNGTHPMHRAPELFGHGRQRVKARVQRLGLAIIGGRASSGWGRTRGKWPIPVVKEI